MEDLNTKMDISNLLKKVYVNPSLKTLKAGEYHTITEAINDASSSTIIQIQPDIYEEQIVITYLN